MVTPLLSMAGKQSQATAVALPFPRSDAKFGLSDTTITANGITYTLISTGTFNAAYPARWAFNTIEAVDATSLNNGGGVLASPVAASLGIDFGVGVRVASYRVSLCGVGYGAESPRNWTFEGSDNNSTWTTLDTHLNTVITEEANIDRTISTPQTFRYYRLNVASTNGPGRWLIDGLFFYA